MIRMSFLQGFNQGLEGILRSQEKTFTTQAQISSGKRLTTAADDPVAAARMVKIDQEQSQTRQFIDNADSLESRLNLEEAQLEGVTNLLLRVREQAVYAANGVLSQTERQTIAVELQGRLDELVNLANSRSTNGEYIFAGFQGGEPAFVENTQGGYDYQGDEGQRLVTIATSTTIPANDSGKDIFVDVPSVQNMFFTEASLANTGTAKIREGHVVDQASFAASSNYGYELTLNGANFEVRELDASGAPIAAVLHTEPQGTTGTTISFSGWSVELNSTAANGDQFVLNSSSTPKQSMMDTIGKLVAGLETLTDSQDDRETLGLLMAESLDNLKFDIEKISEINAKIGSRFNTLGSVREVNQGVALVNESILSDIRDLDYAEAVSRLSMESFTLEAAQQSYAKVNSLSLFNFLR